MTYKIHDDLDGLGVLIIFTGKINGNEIYQLNHKLMTDQCFTQWRYQIWDFSDVEKLNISLAELRSFALQDAEAAQINPNQRIAIIPQKGSVSHIDGIFHIYEQVWGGYESKSFTNREAAREWAKR